MEWLANLTQPQATLGAAAFTFAGAIVAVLLGWALFSAKVRDMRTAISATDELVKNHHALVQQALVDIEAKIGGLAVSAVNFAATFQIAKKQLATCQRPHYPSRKSRQKLNKTYFRWWRRVGMPFGITLRS